MLVDLKGLEGFAEKLAETLKPPMRIALCGELGAGKTTLTRALVKALGSSTPVSSPSYVLQHFYESSRLTVEHWDLYRLGGLPEELDDEPAPGIVQIVEWGDKIPGFIESCDGVVEIAFSSSEQVAANEEFREVTWRGLVIP